MEKYITFGLYQQNPQGGHQEVQPFGIEGQHVYLTSEADARITQLEHALATIALGSDRDCDGALERFEIEQIAMKALGKPAIEMVRRRECQAHGTIMYGDAVCPKCQSSD